MSITATLNAHSIERPYYSEITIPSGRAPIVLSIWEADEAASPTIVFVPGTMTHPLFYSPFLDAVRGNGYHVVGVHQLSHGRSPRIVQRFTLDDMVGNVTDAIGYASERFGGPVGLMGSSQGGVLTLLAAGRDHRIAAAFPHNVLFTPLPESLTVTRFPAALGRVYAPLRRVLGVAGRLAPGLRIPMSFYLDDDLVFSDAAWREAFYTDPLGLTSYPVSFLASLFATDMDAVADGSIACPVVAFVSTGDPLFTLGYSRLVYDRIVAPSKRLVELPADHHLVLNEHVERALPAVFAALDEQLRPGVPAPDAAV